METVDLCDERLGTTVHSEAMESDGYEIANLVNSQRQKRKRGYRPESYISGCLEIDIKFAFPVRISSLSFKTSLPHENPNSFHQIRPPKCTIRVCNKAALHQTNNKNNHINNNTDNNNNKHRDFHIASSVSISASTLHFTLVDGDVSRSKSENCFHLYARHILRNCRVVRITISTFGADRWLGDLSVRGWLSSSTYLGGFKVEAIRESLKTVQELQKRTIQNNTKKDSSDTATKINPESFSKKPESSCSKRLKVTETFSDSNQNGNLINQSEEDIPNEFLDALTHDIMDFPILLPSGNYIDQSSLRKHCKEEGKWGREPSDPFTGLLFTSSARAIHDPVLKHRIEAWKDDTSNTLAPRSVGVSSSLGPVFEQVMSRSEDTRTLRQKRLQKLDKNENEGECSGTNAELNKLPNLGTNSTEENLISNVKATTETEKLLEFQRRLDDL